VSGVREREKKLDACIMTLGRKRVTGRREKDGVSERKAKRQNCKELGGKVVGLRFGYRRWASKFWGIYRTIFPEKKQRGSLARGNKL